MLSIYTFASSLSCLGIRQLDACAACIHTSTVPAGMQDSERSGLQQSQELCLNSFMLAQLQATYGSNIAELAFKNIAEQDNIVCMTPTAVRVTGTVAGTSSA